MGGGGDEGGYCPPLKNCHDPCLVAISIVKPQPKVPHAQHLLIKIYYS